MSICYFSRRASAALLSSATSFDSSSSYSSFSSYRWNGITLGGRWKEKLRRNLRWGIRASMADSRETGRTSDFAKRMEQAWLISQQPGPVMCASCKSKGHVDCKWCRGTGFFIIGDNLLCEVPSRNTSCVVCAGEGSALCCHCKGTGFRAKWLEKPPPSRST